ncbi:GAF domain-containing protein [Halobaculum lipolyticum]|uniref:GAF domain-containing protein n=1 Tax=Halobaculum lipolyticum TaxID=3032001 RepID=A0ABD5WB27_9EURY|nr:GAF domain-containing protein [Halobaculum sp. DT31]
MERSVLCVDERSRLDAVTDAIDAEATLAAEGATSVAAATERVADGGVAAVVTAYDLPDGSGMDVVETVREEAPQTPCVLFTDVPPTEIDTGRFGDSIVEYLSRDLPDAYDRLGFVAGDVIDHSVQVGFLAPDDEPERLAALAEYDVDSLPVEESFARLTDLIASHFDAGVAFIGLIERDEENFLACHGADLDSLTREETICTHSMLQEDVMVVPDVRADKRFSENGSLDAMGIRSYAGANMTTPDGHVIGQVCLIDFEVRDYDEAERAELQEFAETAMEILELRRQVRDAAADAEEVPA